MGEMSSRAYRDVLALPGARALIGASAASQIGNWIYNAALIGYVYSATHSAVWVGAATICRGLPYVLFGPLGGVVADRYPRRTVLLAGDALRTLLMAAIAATVAGAGPVALVIALTALASTAGCAEKAATMALPRLVVVRLGGKRAPAHCQARSRDRPGDPARGGPVLGRCREWRDVRGRPADIGRPDRAPAGRHTSGVGQLAAGMRTVRTTAFALWLIVAMAMAEFTYGAQTVQLVVYARKSLGLGSGGYGVLLTAAGVGGLVSAVVNGRLATGKQVSLIVIAGSLACAAQLAYAASRR
jgi:hypothetical protein